MGRMEKEIIVETEVIETGSTFTTDIDELEAQFNKFISDTEEATTSAAGAVNMDELNEIGDEIIAARQYLESFAAGEKKSVREKAYNQLVALPLIGGWAKDKVQEVQTQALKDSNVKEVLQGIFDKFDVKKKRLLELTEMANNIGKSLQAQEKELAKYITTLDKVIETTQDSTTKLRAYDMSNQAQYQDKVIKEQIYNKLAFIVDMMEQLYMRMSKTVPAIKTQLMNETQISGMINSIADSVKMMGELQDLTNSIAKTSTEKVQSLIVDVTKDLTDGSDVEFYKESAKRNIEFQETMKKSRVKMIESTINTYEELKQIGIDTSNQLESRIDAERKALGMTIETMKSSVAANDKDAAEG
jgi:hypothetical protein